MNSSRITAFRGKAGLYTTAGALALGLAAFAAPASAQEGTTSPSNPTCVDGDNDGVCDAPESADAGSPTEQGSLIIVSGSRIARPNLDSPVPVTSVQAGELLARSTHPNRLVLTGTVQEEVGLRGAKSAAFHAKPDVAIVLEGPPADDTPGFSRAESQGRLGGGVQIRLFDPTAIANPRLVQLAIETAKAENIPHQVTVRRSGGTDAGSFHLANSGVPTVVLGVPARYIHSHNAIIDVNDYLHLVSLTVALARKLDAATVESLTRYL